MTNKTAAPSDDDDDNRPLKTFVYKGQSKDKIPEDEETKLQEINSAFLGSGNLVFYK